MTYYSPKWMAGLSFVVSALIACSYPIFGLIFANITFVFLDHDQSDYIHLRNIWCGSFIAFAFLVGIAAFT
jgi:hypothetical protein